MKQVCNQIRRSRGECRKLEKELGLFYYKCDICGWWHTYDKIDSIDVTVEIKE